MPSACIRGPDGFPPAPCRTASGWEKVRLRKTNKFLPYRPNTFDPVWNVLQVNKSGKHFFFFFFLLTALFIPFWRACWLSLYAALKELVSGCSQVDCIAIDARKHTRNSFTAWMWFKDWGTSITSIEAGRNFTPDVNGRRNQFSCIWSVIWLIRQHYMLLIS